MQVQTQMKVNKQEIQTKEAEIQRLQQAGQVYSGAPERHSRRSKRRWAT